MRQMSLAQQAEFQRFAKKSRRERFLEEMLTRAGKTWQDFAIPAKPTSDALRMDLYR